MIMEIDIVHYNGINYTPIVTLIAKAQLNLLLDGMSEPLISIFWDDDLIAAFVENKPVGFISYKYSEYIKTVNIHIGWVEPEYRRTGIYRQMWDELVIKSRDLKAKHIMSTTHLKNHQMRATAKKLGRNEISINLSYKL